MSAARFRPAGPLRGTIGSPPDKSISHRALLIGASATGRTRITGLLEGEDVLATAAALRAFCLGLGGAFEEAPVNGDPVLLRQLLLIVLDNAVKFSPPGTVVEASVTAHADRAVSFIRDSGPGIAASALPHVFERFFRAQSSNGGGTGIGLSIASIIAEAHGASIRIESTPGEGTTVFIEMPLERRTAPVPV